MEERNPLERKNYQSGRSGGGELPSGVVELLVQGRPENENYSFEGRKIGSRLDVWWRRAIVWNSRTTGLGGLEREQPVEDIQRHLGR